MGEAVLTVGFIFAMWVGVFATVRGRGFFGWALLSLFLTPVIACIILLCLPKLDQATRRKVVIVVMATALVTLVLGAGLVELLADPFPPVASRFISAFHERKTW